MELTNNGKLLPLIPINNQRIPLKGWTWAELARAGTDYMKPYRQLLENNYDLTVRMEKEIYGFAVIPANLNLAVIDFDFDDEESIHRARNYVRQNKVPSHSIIKTPNGIHIWSKVKDKNEYDLPALIARKYKIPEVKYRCPVPLPGSKRKKKNNTLEYVHADASRTYPQKELFLTETAFTYVIDARLYDYKKRGRIARKKNTLIRKPADPTNNLEERIQNYLRKMPPELINPPRGQRSAAFVSLIGKLSNITGINCEAAWQALEPYMDDAKLSATEKNNLHASCKRYIK